MRIPATLLFLSLFCCPLIKAQQTENRSEIQSIESVVNLYFEGWATGDTTKVGKAMHSTCQLKFFSDGKFTTLSRADYLSRFKPHARPDSLVTRIGSMDLTGNIASVKAEIITTTHVFTDYFNMIKTDEQWFIVDKVSTRRTK
ncbi:MAG: nuclear transport factor 2 family protein [Bacteroidetes bacterium]|nr:nuclear transport factor 2 family protein [Bacteroidota bacterium]